jgi:hypothetical protein
VSRRTHYVVAGISPVCGFDARWGGRTRTFTRRLEEVDCLACLRVVASGITRPVVVRVYPVERERLYATCYVWPSRRAMYRHRPLDRNHEAATTEVDGWIAGRRSPCFAELNFFRASLGVEVVTHEFGHAAHCWRRRKGIDVDSPAEGTLEVDHPEELYCYALGRMVRQFYARVFALGLEVERGRRGE